MSQPFTRFQGTDRYLSNESLESAVNCALVLERPLLIRGEPGTGKTLLAEAVSEALGMKLIRWNVKSTTRAQDGLYVYDTVQRLYDSRFQDKDVSDIENYIELGPMGKAFDADERVVLLIDEIDRADEEFEGFLLELLSDFQITIPELGTFRAEEPPVVVITSNRTREVHDALKRRCLYFWIDYPDFQKELQIVTTKVPEASRKLAQQVTSFVQELRAAELYKVAGVAETLDWTAALVALNQEELDPAIIDDTLGIMLKYHEDIEAVRGEPVRAMLNRARNRGTRRGGARG